jgi:hypothetical protein
MSAKSNPNYSSIFGDIYRTDWAIYAEHSGIPTVTSSPYDAEMYKMYLFAKEMADEMGTINDINYNTFKNDFSNYFLTNRK